MNKILNLNNRQTRNNLLYAKKAPLNTPECQFRGVFIQEDLTQRSKLLKFIEKIMITQRKQEQARVGEGLFLKRIVALEKNILIENPDDLFKIGLDEVDVTQFGYPDM